MLMLLKEWEYKIPLSVRLTKETRCSGESQIPATRAAPDKQAQRDEQIIPSKKERL